MLYLDKYQKYKTKYIRLKEIIGGKTRDTNTSRNSVSSNTVYVPDKYDLMAQNLSRIGAEEKKAEKKAAAKKAVKKAAQKAVKKAEKKAEKKAAKEAEKKEAEKKEAAIKVEIFKQFYNKTDIELYTKLLNVNADSVISLDEYKLLHRDLQIIKSIIDNLLSNIKIKNYKDECPKNKDCIEFDKYFKMLGEINRMIISVNYEIKKQEHLIHQQN